MSTSLVGGIDRLVQAAKLKSWSRSTKAFVYGSGLLTVDEHDEATRSFPERQDFDFFWELLDRNDDIWCIKSRQNMVSWALRASDLRLVLFRPNVKLALVFDDKDDGIDHIENRIKPMFESLPEWFRSLYVIRQAAGIFEIESRGGERWRSFIEPIARGSNKLRSRTYTRIDWEEAATQDWMEEAYMGARPTVQGKRNLATGKVQKGQVVIVSTPIPDSYFLKLGGVKVEQAVLVSRGALPPTEEVSLPVPYVATWKNEFNFSCLAWYELSDPAKSVEWQEREAATIPGGRASDHWQQEHEMNCHVLRGRATYWAFNYHLNVIQTLPVPIEKMRTWTIFLSADFGATDPTCWLFWAEDPVTKTLCIWDSVYCSNTPILEIKKRVYAKLRAFMGHPPEFPLDIRSVVRYAVGDPQGKGYMQEYSSQPYPIPVGGNHPDLEVKINDRFAGETRLNNAMAVQFACCGETYYLEAAVCPRCGREHRGRPRLLMVGPSVPELVDQIPRQRKLVPRDPSLEITQRDVKVPDHAVDAAKYGIMTRPVAGAPVQNFQSREVIELSWHNQLFHAHLKKTMERKVKEGEDQHQLAIDAYGCLTSAIQEQYFPDEEDEDVLAW